MSLVLAHATTDPTEAVVLVSELESGGFHPVLFDYHHSFIALGYLQALGGIRIMLPDYEIDSAKDYLQLATAVAEFDPIRSRGLKDIAYATILSLNPFFPMALLPPIMLAVLAVAFIGVNSYFVPQPIWVSVLEEATILYVIAMLAHAKYVAVPKLRENL